MQADPGEDLGKAKFMPGYRAVDKSVSIDPFYFEIETIASQEHISSREGDSLVPVDEPMVVADRLHEGCGFLLKAVVVTRLGTKNGCFHRTLVADTVTAAEQLDEAMLHSVDFGHCKELRHLLSQPLQ